MLVSEEFASAKLKNKTFLRLQNRFFEVFCDLSTKRLEPPDHFWYIDTKTELPQWNKGRNPYDLNFSNNMDRFDEELKLWFYTFELDESTADKWYSVSEYDELNGW